MFASVALHINFMSGRCTSSLCKLDPRNSKNSINLIAKLITLYSLEGFDYSRKELKEHLKKEVDR